MKKFPVFFYFTIIGSVFIICSLSYGQMRENERAGNFTPMGSLGSIPNLAHSDEDPGVSVSPPPPPPRDFGASGLEAPLFFHRSRPIPFNQNPAQVEYDPSFQDSAFLPASFHFPALSDLAGLNPSEGASSSLQDSRSLVEQVQVVDNPDQVTEPDQETILTVVFDIDGTFIAEGDGTFIVLRPGIKELFENLLIHGRKIRVLLWTAAGRIHAQNVIGHLAAIAPHGFKIDFVIVRGPSWMPMLNYYLKDLNRLRGCTGQVVLIDNNYSVASSCGGHAVFVPTFRLETQGDNILTSIQHLLSSVINCLDNNDGNVNLNDCMKSFVSNPRIREEHLLLVILPPVKDSDSDLSADSDSDSGSSSSSNDDEDYLYL